MPVTDKTSLKELKALIKEHVKSLPKMSSGKMALALYAEKNGLIKKEPKAEEPIEVKSKALPPVKQEPKKAIRQLPVKSQRDSASLEPQFQQRKAMPDLPKSLKKVTVEPVAPTKKAPSGFALFMSQNKGQGYTMSQMSQMYKESKEQE